LDNIQVAACRTVTKDGGINQIQPIATVVGTNKTTTLNSPAPKILQSFIDVLSNDNVV
jgi:hypothetical protein